MSPLVTSAVPLTTIQCSARWWCICRLSEAPGLTMMRLTWWRGPWSMLSYQPQGRCTLRCRFCSPRLLGCSSWLTISLTSWLRSRLATSTASGVSTTTTLSRPTALTSRLVACTRVLLAVLDDGVAHAGVALRVLGGHLPHGLPGAQVVPAGVQRHHADGPGRCRGTSPSPRSPPTRSARRQRPPCPGARTWRRSGAGPRRRGWRGDVGAKALQRCQPHRWPSARTCRRSRSTALGQVGLGGGQVGLLDKAGHDRHAIGIGLASVLM